MANLRQYKEGNSYVTLYKGKVNDLKKFLKMREYNITLDEAEFLLRTFYVLHLKLENNDILRAKSFAGNSMFGVYLKYKDKYDECFNSLVNYNSKNWSTKSQLIIEKLNITSVEQMELQIIISKKEKNRRSYAKEKQNRTSNRNESGFSFIEKYKRLKLFGLSKSEIAKELGIGRTTLYRKLAKLNIE